MGKSGVDLIVRIGLVLVGFGALTVGLTAYDWRIAAVVVGASLLLAGLFVPYDEE